MKETIIREGEEKDIPAALALVKELAIYERAGDEVEVTVAQMKDWGFGKQKVFGFFVAEVEGRIRGMTLYYYKYSTWKGKCIFLEDIIVTEAYRRKGIGELLFMEVARVARKESVKRLEWQVLEWNEPALAFYKKYHAQFDGEWINCKLDFEKLQSL